MCHNMRRALKILSAVADIGFKRTPEDQEKRSSLVKGLFMTKYDRAKAAKAAEKLAEDTCL